MIHIYLNSINIFLCSKICFLCCSFSYIIIFIFTSISTLFDAVLLRNKKCFYIIQFIQLSPPPPDKSIALGDVSLIN